MRFDKWAISDRLTIDHMPIVRQRSKFTDLAVELLKLLRLNSAGIWLSIHPRAARLLVVKRYTSDLAG